MRREIFLAIAVGATILAAAAEPAAPAARVAGVARVAPAGRVAPVARVAPAAPAAPSAHSSIQASEMVDLRFHQHMGAQLPLGAEFRDAAGKAVRLGDYFRSGEPVVVILEYLHCRSLCGFVIKDTARALSLVPLKAGKDYQVVAISIDPRDKPADAREARTKYLGSAPSKWAGWHFLTGTPGPIHAVAQTVGFSYRYDPAIDQYAHPAGITITTPRGSVARYILGVGYRPLDVRLALTEASRGHISSPVADLLLLCYCYDPGTGRYSFAIRSTTRALCGATLLGIGLLIFSLSRKRRT